jgi:hypothetical protein
MGTPTVSANLLVAHLFHIAEQQHLAEDYRHLLKRSLYSLLVGLPQQDGFRAKIRARS